MVAMLSVVFTSCGSDDEENDTISLVGKTFSAYAYKGGGYTFMGVYISEYDVYWVYRFTTSSTVERTAREKESTGKIIGDIENYTYVLEYPTIKITDKEGHTSTGTFVDTNTFRIGKLEYN